MRRNFTADAFDLRSPSECIVPVSNPVARVLDALSHRRRWDTVLTRF
jgi:hypothetical protein